MTARVIVIVIVTKMNPTNVTCAFVLPPFLSLLCAVTANPFIYFLFYTITPFMKFPPFLQISKMLVSQQIRLPSDP